MNSLDDWSIAEGEIDDLPVIIRFREKVDRHRSSRSYTSALRIVWEYQADEDHGFPEDDEMNRLDAFEDAIERKLESDDLAIVVFVMTHAGIRQWLLYTRDADEALRRLEAFTAPEGELLPIELTSSADPEWEEYRHLAASLGRPI